MRAACIDILHAHVSKHLPISRDGYEFAVRDWTIEPVKYDGQIIGAILFKDNEIHMAVKPDASKHWVRRSMFRDFIASRIEQYGHLVSSVSKNNSVAIRAVERLGFYRTGEDGQFITYRIDNANFT